MSLSEHKVLHSISEELISNRFHCFNENLNYYRDIDSSRESYDLNSFHIELRIDKQIAAYTRLTPCPYNYMNLCKPSDVKLPCDEKTLEMGRTFVMPKFRGLKLVNTILLIGLQVCEVLGYETVIGNESYESHLAMPSNNGWEFINVVANFEMPFSNKGNHLFYVIKCDLKKTNELRKERLIYYKNFLATNNYDLITI